MVTGSAPSAAKKRTTRRLWQSITFKIGLGPAIGVVMLSIMLCLMISGIHGGLKSVAVQDRTIEAISRGQEASVTMLSLQSDLFKLSGWLIMQGNPEDAEKIRTDISAEVESLNRLSKFAG
jgi:hypothetical protein